MRDQDGCGRVDEPVGYTIAGVTLMAVAGSSCITALIMYFSVGVDFAGTINVTQIWYIGMSISVLAPSAIAPVLVGRVRRLVIELRRANAMLEEITRKDPLTGLLNRRGIDAAAGQIFSEARAGGAAVSALMCDIDFFKTINDRFGHDVGDLALIHVAKLIGRTLVSSGSLLGRHGGEEFVVLLPDVDGPAARIMADAIRAACEAEPLILGNQIVEMTLSIGVASGVAGKTTSRLLLVQADTALYQAKQDGRNRVSVASASSFEDARYGIPLAVPTLIMDRDLTAA